MSRFRIFPEMPWLLAGIATMAILAHGMPRPCRAEERPVVENSLGMKLVSIPAGEFVMGGTKQEVEEAIKATKKRLEGAEKSGDKETVFWAKFGLERLETETPQHRVILTKPFFLGNCAVTQQEFAKIMGFNPSSFSASSKKKQRELVVGQDTSAYPVETVSWDDAVEFCRQLSAAPAEVAAGRSFRLPTEAEWEYACRAGTSTIFFWGNALGPKGGRSLADEFAWGTRNSDQHLHPVGQKRPNPWGLFDMGSNLKNWCADWVEPGSYAASPLRDPTGPTSGTERIARGNAFNLGPARSGARSWFPPKRGIVTVGFRVACDVSAPPQVANAASETGSMKDAEARLKEKGLSRRMGYFLLPEEAQLIRYVTTIERLRMACFHAQKECQDAQRQLSRVQSAKAGAIQSRMQAQTTMNYSENWREHWASVRARNNANDAVMLVDLSKEGVQKWQQDAQADLDSAVELFAGQIDKLQKMYRKLQKDYATLYEDATVKHTLADLNSTGKVTYRIGPTPSASAAVKKLEHEQGLLAQFKKN